jgi:hypothetical protein
MSEFKLKISMIAVATLLATGPFLLFLGCPTYPHPDFVSEAGIRFYFYTELWNPEDIKRQEQWFVEELSKNDQYPIKKIKEALVGVEVYVYADPVKCSISSTGLCNGVQNLWFIYLHNTGSVCNSAFSHELLHFLQYRLHSNVDYEHKETELWIIADGHYPDCAI